MPSALRPWARTAGRRPAPEMMVAWALARRAERRARLAAARDRLVAEDQARRDTQRAKQEAWDAAAAAGKRRNNTPPPANTTDPDVRVMRNQKGHVSGYNGQLVVTAQQVIVGAMLSPPPVDRTLLHPLLDQCRGQLAAAGIQPKLRIVLADSGYVTEDNFTRAEEQKLRLLAPLGKDPATHRVSNSAGRRDFREHPVRSDQSTPLRSEEPVYRSSAKPVDFGAQSGLVDEPEPMSPAPRFAAEPLPRSATGSQAVTALSHTTSAGMPQASTLYAAHVPWALTARTGSRRGT